MSNAVWVIIALPTVEREKQLKQEVPPVEKTTLSDSESVGSHGESISHKENASPGSGSGTPLLRKGINEIPLKKVLEEAFEELALTDVVWYLTKNGKGYQVYFPCDLESSDTILEFFHSKGIGYRKETFIGMIPFALFYKDTEYDAFDDGESGSESQDDKTAAKAEPGKKLFSFKSIQEKFLKSITARLTVAQVVASVQSGADLTFDFVCYTILAAWIAAMGLLDNSVVNTVASMLVSPLMGPVMAMTFGTIIRNKPLREMGMRNALIGFLICVLFGYAFGLIVLNFTQEWNPDSQWPTGEMQSRGQYRILWVGCLVALPSGAAVAVSLLSGNQSSLVGVAISASLLPPCVNCGLLWAFATLKGFRSLGQDSVTMMFNDIDWEETKPALLPPSDYKVNYSHNMALECFIMGIVSLGLTTVNVICIFIMAYLVLRIKEVAPNASMSPSIRRFWQEDVKIARDYNKSVNSANDTLGEDFLREWAAMTGLDEKQLMSDRPEARVTQLQTLRDMLKDVESDDVFRSIVRSTQAPEVDLIQQHSRRNSLYPQMAWDLEQGMAGQRRGSTMLGAAGGASRRASRALQARRTSAFCLKVPEGSNPEVINQRRRSSALLRRSLQTADHLPYSVWPQARSRSDSRFTVTPVTEPVYVRNRRASKAPRLASTSETNFQTE